MILTPVRQRRLLFRIFRVEDASFWIVGAIFQPVFNRARSGPSSIVVTAGFALLGLAVGMIVPGGFRSWEEFTRWRDAKAIAQQQKEIREELSAATRDPGATGSEPDK